MVVRQPMIARYGNSAPCHQVCRAVRARQANDSYDGVPTYGDRATSRSEARWLAIRSQAAWIAPKRS